MPSLIERYSKILSDIEEHISNPDERKYVVKKVEEISSIYIELIDRLTKLNDARIAKLEEKQDKMVATVAKMQETLNLIKNDIYEDENYDFEIVCPYCNHEFVADVEDELKEEIECPECHNIIELDWDDDECKENCGGCHQEECENKNSDVQKDDKINNDDDM